MRVLNHINAKTLKEASAAMKQVGTVAVAGGGDLLGTLKDDIYREYPKLAVNLKTIPGLDDIRLENNILKIGAMTTLADITRSPLVRAHAGIVAEAAGKCASPTLRENTTIGGNICQMPRCWYYRKLQNRFDCARKGGSRCFAINGDNRYHSIFGGIKPNESPCSRACPAGTDVPAYMEALRNGSWDEAVNIILQANPLPMFTSRICPHPCQDDCSQGAVGEAVNIRCVERSAADYMLANMGKFYTQPAQESGKSVAIVGAGPGGLSAAFYLRKAGHTVTVFDRRPKAGGVMRYGVPHFRLQKDIVDTLIAAYEGMGIIFRCGINIGKDITVEELDEQYDGIFFGTGAWKQPIMGIGGEELALFGLDFLTEVNTYLQKTIGKNVVVCGGGNVAMDAALTAKRLGAEKVTVVYRRSMKEIPAGKEEVDRAVEEGVAFCFLSNPTDILTDGTNVDRIRCIRMKLDEPDEEGRRRSVEIPGSAFELDADYILLATGQAVDLSFLGEKFLKQLQSARGLIDVNKETFRTSKKGIYAAGDAATGPSIAIRAIAGGRIAAMNLSRELGVPIEPRGLTGGFVHFDAAGTLVRESAPQPVRAVETRTLTDDDAASYTPEQLDQEIRRCMNCACYAVNQAETVPSLICMDAKIQTTERLIPVAEFFGVGIAKTTVLHAGEIVTEIQIPLQEGGRKGRYKRFSFRKSIDFPIVNLAISADQDRHYRICLGGVAPVPYRAEKAEAVLDGKEITEELAVQAGLAAVEGAEPFEANAYKVQLVKTLIKRELLALFGS
jgi:NADPH-dependent glutamate synthase beta subunit-like oxidoreductase/CO/xanthine dehydrogenase FAD-binding subunit